MMRPGADPSLVGGRRYQYFKHPPRSHSSAAQRQLLIDTAEGAAHRVEEPGGDGGGGASSKRPAASEAGFAEGPPPPPPPRKSITPLMLLALMYTFSISGAYGVEESVMGGGPLLTLIIIMLIPIFMGIPTALVVAELATAIPSNAGFLMWVNVSFHRVVYFAMVLLSLLLTFVDNALYPVLFSEYVCTAVTCTPTTTKLLRGSMLVVTYTLNIIGIEAVGAVSIALTVLTVAPFALMFILHLLTTGFFIHWRNMSYIPPRVNWAMFVTTASWNLSGLEQAGSVAEDIKHPQTSIVSALLQLIGLALITYLPPVITGASTSRAPIDISQWVTGYWSTVSYDVAGEALKGITVLGSILSAFGLTLSALCTTSHMIAGVAQTEAFPGMASEWLSARSDRFGSYHWAITLNAVATMTFSVFLDFGPLVKVDQFLYGIRAVLMFLAFIRIRQVYPDLDRPFKVPGGTRVLAAALLVPVSCFTGLTVVAIAQDTQTMILCTTVTAAAVLVSVLYCYTLRPSGFQGSVETAYAAQPAA